MDGADPYSDGILKTPIVIDNVRMRIYDLLQNFQVSVLSIRECRAQAWLRQVSVEKNSLKRYSIHSKEKHLTIVKCRPA